MNKTDRQKVKRFKPLLVLVATLSMLFVASVWSAPSSIRRQELAAQNQSLAAYREGMKRAGFATNVIDEMADPRGANVRIEDWHVVAPFLISATLDIRHSAKVRHTTNALFLCAPFAAFTLDRDDRDLRQ